MKLDFSKIAATLIAAGIIALLSLVWHLNNTVDTQLPLLSQQVKQLQNELQRDETLLQNLLLNKKRR